MKVNKKQFSTLWEENNVVKIIDQTKLPFEFVVIELKTLSDFCVAIKDMKVRGAPLIGITAAFGLAFSIKKNPSMSNIKKSYDKLVSTRPTAINLKWALNMITDDVKKIPEKNRIQRSIDIARNMRNNDIINCIKIGLNGYKIIKKIYDRNKKRVNILTHCNAGWLATIDWGTALAPIFFANRNKIPIHVWVDETRPRNQGALLTAWELKNENIPYTVIVDNAGGYLMQNKKVDMCIVGSDRTTYYGDVCNKIGTYLKALSAFDNDIPFYVALPYSSIDFKTKNFSRIPIEERNGKELTHVKFKNKNQLLVGEIYSNSVNTYNPAFDVTPSKFITRLITENGTIKPNKIDILKHSNK